MKLVISFEQNNMNYIYKNFDTFCEDMASFCHYNCPMEKFPCPFGGSKNCNDVTKENWKDILHFTIE